MVNYSTNINKTINHLSPQIIEYKKKPTPHMMSAIQVLTWGRCKKVEGLNQTLPILIYSLDLSIISFRIQQNFMSQKNCALQYQVVMI